MVTLNKLFLYIFLSGVLWLISYEEAKAKESVSDPYTTGSFVVRGTPTITIRPGQGTITFIGTESNEVRIEVFAVRRGLNLLGSDKISDDYNVTMRQRGNEVVAEVVARRGGAWNSNAPSFNFVVYAPNRSNASLFTSSGDVTIENIRGTIDVRNAAGNIIANGCTGTARLSSAAGSIAVKSHSGTVLANAVAGDVIMNDVDGETRLKVIAGNAMLDQMIGSFIVHVTNGNINLEAVKIDQLLDVESVLGNISINIPGRNGLDLNVQGQQVNVGVIANFAGDIRRNSIIGKLNGGGTPIRIKSTVGNIDLTIDQIRQ